MADRDFPAERCAAAEPVSALDGRSVLVTTWAEPVPRQGRREAIRAAGGLGQLGALLGRLHVLPPGPGALARPGGAWHHLADGRPAAAEVAAASQLPPGPRTSSPAIAGRVRGTVRAGRRARHRRRPAGGADPSRLRARERRRRIAGMVLVDWAGAGRGPRLVARVPALRGGRQGPAEGRRVLAGYRMHVTLRGGGAGRLAGHHPGPPAGADRLGGLHRPRDADRGARARRRDQGRVGCSRPGPARRSPVQQARGARDAEHEFVLKAKKLLLSRTGNDRAATPAAPTGGQRRTGGKPPAAHGRQAVSARAAARRAACGLRR